MAEQRLTRDDELFIATRLLARARHSSKKLAQGMSKPIPLHPQLLKEIRIDIAECTRLALLLQQEPDEEIDADREWEDDSGFDSHMGAGG